MHVTQAFSGAKSGDYIFFLLLMRKLTGVGEWVVSVV